MVDLALEQRFNHKICVSYCNHLILGYFVNGLVNKIRNYVLDILLGLLRDNYVTNQRIKADTMYY